MSTSKPKRPSQNTYADTGSAVEQFMARLQHPFKAGIEKLRNAILAVDTPVTEGIEWNARSVRTTEYFATGNLRAKSGSSLVLHLGAKVRASPPGGVTIEDPTKLLKPLAPPHLERLRA